MKFFVAIFLTALVAFAESLYFPWWTIAIAAFIVAVFIHQRPGKAFAAGFLGLFLLWLLQATIIDFQNDHILSQRIAGVLPMSGSSVVIIIVTAVVGGLVGGMGALTGSFVKKAE